MGFFYLGLLMTKEFGAMNIMRMIKTLSLMGLFMMSTWVHAGTTFKTSGVLSQDLQTMEWNGATLMVGILSGVGEVYDSTSGAVPKGSLMLTCGLRALQLKPSTELLANCSWKDSSGDELFVVSVRRSGTTDVGGGGNGTMSIIGGTGKYSGMTGDCTYSVAWLESPWMTTESTCTTN